MKSLLTGVFLLTHIPSGSRVVDLKKEANDALYNISFCTEQFSKILTNGAWVGGTKRWDSKKNKNYGYNYQVMNTSKKDSSTYKVGVISLVATAILNPAGDTSSFKYECTVKK